MIEATNDLPRFAPTFSPNFFVECSPCNLSFYGNQTLKKTGYQGIIEDSWVIYIGPMTLTLLIMPRAGGKVLV